MQKNTFEQINYFESFYDDFKKNIFMTQISPNQQLLLYTDSKNQLSILKLKTKLKKKYNLVSSIGVRCQFNSLSNIVYFGDLQGDVISFTLNSTIKQIRKNATHSERVSDILLIEDNRLITCSPDLSIMVKNTQNCTPLVCIIYAHQLQINSIGYDSIKEIIISCSNDKSIKFFDENMGVIINQQNAHNYCVQEIELDQQYLFSFTYYDLIKWQITEENLLLKLQQFTYDYSSSFSLVLDKTAIILTKKNCFLILDQDFKLLKEINHKISTFYRHYQLKQMNYLQYIIVSGTKSIQIFSSNKSLKGLE